MDAVLSFDFIEVSELVLGISKCVLFFFVFFLSKCNLSSLIDLFIYKSEKLVQNSCIGLKENHTFIWRDLVWCQSSTKCSFIQPQECTFLLCKTNVTLYLMTSSVQGSGLIYSDIT